MTSEQIRTAIEATYDEQAAAKRACRAGEISADELTAIVGKLIAEREELSALPRRRALMQVLYHGLPAAMLEADLAELAKIEDAGGQLTRTEQVRRDVLTCALIGAGLRAA